jgi:peptide chain release factor 1
MDSVILEIKPGVGGEEAALFAKDLLRMYLKYAQRKNWKVELLNIKESDLGGIKEVVFELKGDDVYSEIKYEAGVHRVQRIPKTEKSGRIHTSTATVAVLKKPKSEEIKINPNDLEFDFFKSSGAGGQYVNKRMTAVRVKHLPTGIVVTCQTERSLQQNKESALELLRAKILQKKEEEEKEKLLKEKREQIKSADRSEKIRTYNFPQNRLTDHRIKKSWQNLGEILDGNLDKVIKSLKNLST